MVRRDPQGHERLRTALAAMLSSTRGLVCRAEDVCITRGSQMGIGLLARALLRRGGVVAVEELSYPRAVEAFRMQGARLVPISLDQEGIRIEPLERLARSGRLRMVHVTPHHQFPTTVTLSAARRLRLLELARTYQVAVLEEDYDHEFHYDGRPVLPMASADSSGTVIYVGTFSKVLAPGLRIGYIVAPRDLIAAAVGQRLHIDAQGDRVLEYALAELIEEGEVQRHLRRVRREYAARRDVLVDALRRYVGAALTFDIPVGGVGIWVQAASGLDIDAWARRARSSGVVMPTAATFSVNGKARPFARLGLPHWTGTNWCRASVESQQRAARSTVPRSACS